MQASQAASASTGRKSVLNDMKPGTGMFGFGLVEV
jgi:hypothetical protein